MRKHDFYHPAFSSAHLYSIGSLNVLEMHIRPIKSGISHDVTLVQIPISPPTSKSSVLNTGFVSFRIGRMSTIISFETET